MSTIVGIFKAADKWLKLESLHIETSQFLIIGIILLIFKLFNGMQNYFKSDFVI